MPPKPSEGAGRGLAFASGCEAEAAALGRAKGLSGSASMLPTEDALLAANAARGFRLGADAAEPARAASDGIFAGRIGGGAVTASPIAWVGQ